MFIKVACLNSKLAKGGPAGHKQSFSQDVKLGVTKKHSGE